VYIGLTNYYAMCV